MQWRKLFEQRWNGYTFFDTVHSHDRQRLLRHYIRLGRCQRTGFHRNGREKLHVPEQSSAFLSTGIAKGLEKGVAKASKVQAATHVGR